MTNQRARTTIPYAVAWRGHLNLSQEALSRASGVAVSTLIKIERGARANYLTVVKIARAMGLTPSALLTEDPDAK